MPRLAWFSPMPPAPTGVATCSAELVAALRAEHEIDVFVESAHDFLWRHRLAPYDLTVYQLGNSSWHDYMWPYLFRFPGLVVLHDAHLHHARAAALLGGTRADAYRQEFVATHPDASPDLAELAIAGFDTHLYYCWPLTRLVVEGSRLTAVHAASLAQTLRADSPQAAIEAIHLGHGRRIGTEEGARASMRVRERHGIPASAIVFGVFGGLTPEKRVPQVLDAFAALLPFHPDARLLLAGAPARHYDVAADVTRLGIAANTTIVGYVEDDELFDEYVAGCDVSINLRWPSAREVSGPWLRALAAGRPTITTDLAHMADVPALDPRTWRLHQAMAGHTPEAVAVAIDILDEDHSLRLAMRRLAVDKDLRAQLGRAGAAYWDENGSVDRMVADYRRVIARALESPIPSRELPVHLRADGSERLVALLEPFGLPADVWGRI